MKGNAGLLSAGVKASFKTSNEGAKYAFYSYVYESISYAEMILNTVDSKYFTDDFASDLNALPDTFSQENYPQFASFFEKWGLYYLNHSGLGGELDTTNAVATSSSTSTSTAQVDLSAQYKGLYYSGEFDASVTATESWSVFSTESRTQVYIQGGSLEAQGNVLAIDPLNPSQHSGGCAYGMAEIAVWDSGTHSNVFSADLEAGRFQKERHGPGGQFLHHFHSLFY